MRAIFLVLGLTFHATLALAEPVTVKALLKELPQGTHVGVLGGKQSCTVDVAMVGKTYRVIINKPSSTKKAPRFEYSDAQAGDLGMLQDINFKPRECYVGLDDAHRIAGMRTIVQLKSQPDKSIQPYFDILLASDGDWYVRMSGGGPTCKIKATR